jgi:Arc/MetJ-type ribon-helix-helix transcriptional regulator
MRQVLSISVPQQVAQTIKQKVQNRGFSSVSKYIQYLLKLDDELISEQELLADFKIAQQEYDRGETVVAKSIADLVNIDV